MTGSEATRVDVVDVLIALREQLLELQVMNPETLEYATPLEIHAIRSAINPRDGIAVMLNDGTTWTMWVQQVRQNRHWWGRFLCMCRGHDLRYDRTQLPDGTTLHLCATCLQMVEVTHHREPL